MLKEKMMISATLAMLLVIDHPIWYYNAFFYLFVAILITFILFIITYIRTAKRKSEEMKLIQQQHVAKVDIIRKEHVDTLEKIRQEMLKREEERSRQWMESEKETLHVLNGVSMLLDLNGKIGGVESDKILKKLGEIQEKIEKITNK